MNIHEFQETILENKMENILLKHLKENGNTKEEIAAFLISMGWTEDKHYFYRKGSICKIEIPENWPAGYAMFIFEFHGCNYCISSIQAYKDIIMKVLNIHEFLETINVGEWIDVNFTHYSLTFEIVSISQSQSAYVFVLKEEDGVFSFLHYDRGDLTSEGTWNLIQTRTGILAKEKIPIIRNQMVDSLNGVHYFLTTLYSR